MLAAARVINTILMGAGQAIIFYYPMSFGLNQPMMLNPTVISHAAYVLVIRLKPA